jgi:transcriptional regulator with XRE-family HTH domain
VVDPASPSYAIRVGDRLRAVRKELRLSLQAVEAQSRQEFKASVLGAYERGERAISVLRLQRLAAFYNVPVDRLLPPATEISSEDGDAGLTIDLRTMQSSSDIAPLPPGDSTDLVARYVAVVRGRRRANGTVAALRAEDMQLLGTLLGVSADDIRLRLNSLVSAG